MVPDLDLQLQVAIKALTDNVVPAVDPANKMAVEQLQLIVATLAMVRSRLPIARRFARRSLEDDIAMLRSLCGLIPVADIVRAPGHADALADAIVRGRTLLADPEADTDALEDYRTILAEITVSAIKELQHGPAAAAVESLILDATRRSIERRRAWCLPSGFEPYPSRIPAIETLL
jgi:hypothetical protein